MGDRKNPIMFGPEWLRNLTPSEPSAGRSSSRSSSRPGGQSTGPEPGGQASNASVSPPAGPSAGPSTPTPSTSTRNSSASRARSRLAKQRYGREELLALCERSGDPPEELKSFELLYQAREKKPIALLSFEEEVRENTGQRGGPSAGIQAAERFGGVRGTARLSAVPEARGRARLPFLRHALGLPASRATSAPLHTASVRTPGFITGPDEELTPSRPWTASNGGVQPNRTGEQAEWANSKLFRRRPNNLTNWRQTSKDDSDEWRASDNAARQHTRSNSDKWEREWTDNDRRPPLDRPQSWSNNRRTWVNNENDENLPEWAMDNAEAGAGTFDSTGAFHGYNNDDTNIPKPPEANYALSRSHTHAGFSRARRDFEEGSEDWWASEKASKLSPKRFEAEERKTKKPQANESEPQPTNLTAQQTMQDEGCAIEDIPLPPTANMAQATTSKETEQEPTVNKKFPKTKSFSGTMRPHTGFEANDERGNYQSVMLNQNNGLRQQHQNITSSNNNQHSTALYQLLQNMPVNSDAHQEDNIEDILLDGIMDMTLTEEDNIQMGNQTQQPSTHQMQPNTMQIHQTANAQNLQLHQMAAQTLHMLQTSTSQQLHNSGLALVPIPPNIPMAMQSGGLNSQNMPINTGMAPGLAPGLSGMAPGFNTGLTPGVLPMNSAHIAHTQANETTTVGVQNSALNSALGLSRGGNPSGVMFPMQMQGSLPPMLQGQQMSGMAALHSRSVLGGFQNADNIQMPLSASNSSLFMDRSNPPPPIPTPNMQEPSQNAQSPFPIGMQRANVDEGLDSYYNSVMMHRQHIQSVENLANLWYYTDPNDEVQGPFTNSEMLNWFSAGFFSPSLLVRRACEAVMRPLGSYGPVVPFAYEVPSNHLGNFEPRAANTQDLFNQTLGNNNLDEQVVKSTQSRVEPPPPPPPEFRYTGAEQIRFRIQSTGLKPRSMETLWGQPGPSQVAVWAQQRRAAFRGEDAVNNLPPFFWNGPNAGSMNLPADIVKEMKTEDQILAQMRAKQNVPAPQPTPPFLGDSAPTTTSSSTTISSTDDSFNVTATPDLEKLHQLMKSETQTPRRESKSESEEAETKCEKPDKTETPGERGAIKTQPTQKIPSDAKPSKQAKSEPEKPAKTKDTNNVTKTKTKKSKEEKKDDTETKIKEEESKSEKASVESSPTKSKKEEKLSKKEIEKEKKEWIKEGFTIVKGAERTNNKENKKKAEEAKVVEEFERKKKEEEKLASEEEKKKKQVDMVTKKQVEQQQRQITEALVKRAPWSVSSQSVASTKAGLTLSEIQRLEREKKLEQIKEQQHMMHLIAQQQAAALAREQEMQANLAWAKNNLANNGTGPSLAEIQAETRRQSAAAAAAATQAIEDVIPLPQLPTNLVPWGSSTNGGGFWDTQPAASKSEKPQEPAKTAKPVEPKIKKKVTVPNPTSTATASNPTNTTQPANPTNTTNPSNATNSKPKNDFEAWCETVLSLWKARVDVPTFVGFLRDIESPYEVQEYVKCYLGDSKDSGDFVRQFLEKRAKMIREWKGTVTPSDDLCSPAMAINPRPQLSEYQEVKGKGKKSKKNKMLKVDARILGFSVTASEDRINVGDIDTA